MLVAVAGAHGQVAMQLHPLLVGRGDGVRGLIRDPGQAKELERLGVEPVLCDLEGVNDVAPFVEGADAIVFAAGAGAGSGAKRKRTMDLGGAVKLIDAAQMAGVQRYVMISAMGAASPPPSGGDVFGEYLRAKSEADQRLRDSDLDYTIVRPGRLTDEPGTGCVTAGRSLERGEIPRADVASVIAEALARPETVGLSFEVVSGLTPIADAIAELTD